MSLVHELRHLAGIKGSFYISEQEYAAPSTYHEKGKSAVLVVDRKVSLVMEKVDDSKETFAEAVGLSTYSTSEPTIMSYVSIFENFWNQIELYDELKESKEKLKKQMNS